MEKKTKTFVVEEVENTPYRLGMRWNAYAKMGYELVTAATSTNPRMMTLFFRRVDVGLDSTHS